MNPKLFMSMRALQIVIALALLSAVPLFVPRALNESAIMIRNLKSHEMANSPVAIIAEPMARTRGLLAEEAMARWAYWLCVVTGLQIVASLIGIVLVYRTLAESRRATAESRAANETARTELKLSHEHQRAWLKITLEDYRVNKNSQRFHVFANVTCKNVGLTPAINANVAIDIFLMGEDQDPEEKIFVLSETAKTATETRPKTIMPGETETFPRNFVLTADRIKQFMKSRRIGTFVPVIAAAVAYKIVGDVELKLSTVSAVYAEYPDGFTIRKASWKNFKQEAYTFKHGLRDIIT